MQILRVTIAINRILGDLQGEQTDFSVSDIVLPIAKTTRIYMSWLIAYYQVVKDRREFTEEALTIVDQRRIELDKAIFEVQVREGQLKSKVQSVQKMKRDRNELLEKYNHLEEKHDQLNYQVDVSKKKHQKMCEHLATLVEQMVGLI